MAHRFDFRPDTKRSALGVAFGTVVAGACSLTTSLDGLSNGAPGSSALDSGPNKPPVVEDSRIPDASTKDAADAVADLAIDGNVSGYVAAVLADSPVLYWRLGEADAAAPARDSSLGGKDGKFVGRVGLGVPGAIAGGSDTAC